MEIRGKYRVTHLLGEGKFGKVYKGIEFLKSCMIKDVAIKMEQTKFGLLKHETSILNYLNQKKCQNVPIVLWFGIEAKIPCLIIPYYSFPLMEYIKENSIEDELSFMKSMLDILHQIHKLDIIHRDIKPDNIMLNERYQFILIDFGLSIFSKKGNEIKQKNAPNNLMTGNLLFASVNIHEQYKPRKIDDIISLAYIGLFLCLKSSLPWIGKPSIQYFFLKSKENLELYQTNYTKRIISFINELYRKDMLLYFYKE